MADLAAARNSLAAFADMVRRPLTDWQVNSLRLEKRTTCIVAPRQSGKSRSLAVLALWKAFREPGTHVLIISASDDAAKRLLGEVRQIAAESELLRGSVVDDLKALVTLSHGSWIRSVSASEKAVRGWTIDLLLVDEAAQVPGELLAAGAYPTTIARPNARVVLASSASSADGMFYEQAQIGLGGSEYVETFSWALAEATWISAETIAAARERMTPLLFAAEFEGVFASGADAVFSRNLLENATADFVAPGITHGLQGLKGIRAMGGVDWGATTDRSTLIAIARMDRPEGLFAVVAAHAWRAGEQIGGGGGVIEQIAQIPAHWDQISAENNGLGYVPAQDLARRLRVEAEQGQRPRMTLEYVTTTNASKATTYSRLRMLLEQGHLVLPASAVELIRELLLLRVEITPSGGEKIEASHGHDDLADGLYLAAGPYRVRGEWTSRLARAAEQTAPPISMTPGAEEWVKTGAGLVLPRAPAFIRMGGERYGVPTSLPSWYEVGIDAFNAGQAKLRTLDTPVDRWYASLGAPREQVAAVPQSGEVLAPLPEPANRNCPLRNVPGEKSAHADH